jgi:hypothetical protein
MKEPSDTAEIKRPLPKGTPVGEGTVVNEKWLAVDFGPQDDQKGFVLKADCVESGGGRVKVERRGVVQKAVLVEVQFNDAAPIAPWYISADFLIARAIMETGVTNAEPMIPDSDAVGPMQVSTKEWDGFIQNGGALATGLVSKDRNDPLLQINAAAFRMHSDMKAISDLRTPAGSADPFVPQFLDVFFAYLTDSPAAALALRDAIATKENQTELVTKFLRGPLTDVQVKALHKARAGFFGPEDNAKTLGDVVSAVKIALDTALDRAFQDIKLFIPEAVPVVSVPESSGAGTTFAEKAPGIMSDLIRDFAFSDFQAAGILGNIGRETGGFTLFQERHPKLPPGGFGWCQWTADRRVNFVKFCSDHNLDQKSDKANYGFMKFELENSKKSVVPHLKETTSLESATSVFEQEFEIAGVVALSDRITWARRALAAFKGVGTPGTSAHTLQQLVSAGKIIFDEDSPVLKSQLLGLNTGTKVTPKLQTLVLKLCDLTPEKIRISSLVRSATANHSHHTEGRAVDIGNQEIAAALLPKVVQQVGALGIDELIFDARRIDPANDPNKFNFDQGAKHSFDDATIKDHGDHIHFAVMA